MKLLFPMVGLVILLVGCALPSTSTQMGPIDVHIPYIAAPVLLDGKISPFEWEGAWVTNGSFEIHDGGLTDGSYPFSLWIAGDETRFYVAVRIANMGHDPYSPPNGVLPDHVDIYFAMPTGPLAVPSDFIGLSHQWEYGSGTEDGYWNGTDWVLQNDMAPSDYDDGYITGGRWARSSFEGSVIDCEFVIYRTSPLKDYDGLQVAGPGAFNMAVRLIRPPPLDADQPFGIHSDIFPPSKNANATSEPSGWLRLSFDA